MKRTNALPCVFSGLAWYPTHFATAFSQHLYMKLTWTKTDEAPALASYALLPILRAYSRGTGVEIETADLSLAGRIVAAFPERLSPDQKVPDELTRLGELAKTPEANIVAHCRERRSERVAVDLSADFDKSLGSEVVHRIRPNYICPSTVVRTLFELGEEGFVQHEAHDIGSDGAIGQ